MADIQTFSRAASPWVSFLNGTAAVTTTSTGPPTSSSFPSSRLSGVTSVTSFLTASSSLTISPSASSSGDLFAPVSIPTSSLEQSTSIIPDSSTPRISFTPESAPSSPVSSTSNPSLHSPNNDKPLPTPDTSPHGATSTPSWLWSSPTQEPSSTSSTRSFGVPTTSPATESPPALGEEHKAPPILMILAIVISVAIFAVLIPCLLWQRRRQRRQKASQLAGTAAFPRSAMSSQNSLTATYLNANRGAMRVVIERLPVDNRGHAWGAPDAEADWDPNSWYGSAGTPGRWAGGSAGDRANHGIGMAY
ncbi:hypothetical protein F4777DRAFT_576199 [Nemania sp. FL0916]|nr:hypothetical protein F4777DRAFT_576199 [Nemania sp. FL0916]